MSGAALLGAHGPWVEEHLGEVSEAADVSWDHAASDVIRVVSARGSAFLKRHRDRRKFDQERAGFSLGLFQHRAFGMRCTLFVFSFP